MTTQQTTAMTDQQRAIADLESQGWQYHMRDASGRRVIMRKSEFDTVQECRVTANGNVLPRYRVS